MGSYDFILHIWKLRLKESNVSVQVIMEPDAIVELEVEEIYCG